MSTTPRTDAAAFDIDVIGDAYTKRDTHCYGDYVLAEFARDLETELTAARQEVERLRALIEDQPHGPRCHTRKPYPFGDKAREIYNAKGCDCWKSEALNQPKA